MPLTRSKAAKVKQTPIPAAPHLPDELWHRIAGHLSTKDWVGASGTCKQLQQVQLEHLNITATSADGSISALLWLAKQVPSARSVVLDNWPVKSALQLEVASKICIRLQPALNLPESLSKLTVLSVRLGPSGDEEAKQLERTGDLPHMGICLTPILAKAARLSKLELACMSAAGLRPLANLKHLALRLFKFPMSDGISTLLHNMPCLETLQLSLPSASHGCYGERVDAMLVVPASVQRIELINVFPESLVLDSDRTVVRLIGAVCCLQEALVNWPDVRSQLKGLRLYQRVDEFPGMVNPIDASELWDFVEVLQFMRASALTVNVDLHELPRASLGNLTSLHVKMADLCITIPALPGLKDLHLDCSRTLCMSFEDARVSAENLHDFEWAFASICASHTLGVFLVALAETGKRCALQRYSKMRKQLRRHNGSVCEESREQNYHRMQYGSYRLVAASNPWDDLFTACGCEGCLAGLGLDLTWTFRGHMVYSRTDYSEGTLFCPDEHMNGLFGTKCPCGLHSTSTESDESESDDNQ